MSIQKPVSRRNFIQKIFVGAVGFTALPLLGRGLISSAKAEEKACSTSEPVAQAIGFVTQGKDKKKLCADCMFYPANKPANGPCQLIPNCVVPASASCNSFQKRA